MSDRDLPTTSYAVLGLLSLAPMSGYDLAQAADRSIANFWPISKSQVYSELGRLDDLGLVRGVEVSQEKLPDKRRYEITEAGAEVLDAWLVEPGWEPDRHRVGFLVKMFFGHRLAPDRMLGLLDEYRAEAVRYRDYLREVVDALAEVPEAVYQRATALLGLRGTEATIRWADEVRDELIDLRDRFRDHPDEVAEGARALFGAVPERGEDR